MKSSSYIISQDIYLLIPFPTHNYILSMALPFKPGFPWLLYAYPWMPYPRRVIIYLREKGIPESLVKVAQVDQADGAKLADSSLPPKPKGSLPILSIPSNTKNAEGEAVEWVHIRQSMAIIKYLEELCNTQQYGFSAPNGSFAGTDALERARIAEVSTLAEECTTAW